MKKEQRLHLDVDVDGMTLETIIASDPTHLSLSRSSMAKITSRLVSAANKRLSRLEKEGLDIYSQAYQRRIKEGDTVATRFSVKGKSYNELQHEFVRARQFLTERKTASIKGTREVKEATEKRLGRSFSSKEEANMFWDNVKKLEELGVTDSYYTSAQLQRDVAAMMSEEEEIDFDEMLKRVTQNSVDAYENALEDEKEKENPFELKEEYDENEEAADEDSFIHIKFPKIKIY